MRVVDDTATADHLPPPESQWRIVFRRFRRHRLAMVSIGVLLLLLLASIFAPVIAPFPRDEIQLDHTFLAPMTPDPETGTLHLLGTDHLGRDFFTRLIYAARVSLTIAIFVATIASLIGISLGLLAGYFRGWVDIIITRFLEFVSTFPLLVILLILMSVLLQNENRIPLPQPLVDLIATLTAIPDREAKKVTLVVLGLSALTWTTTGRLMRAQVFSVREQPYIEAMRALGASTPRIIGKHVFPNAFPPIIVDFTLQVNTNLVLEAALSFLGFGIQDPTPTWGNMLAFAQSFMFGYWWMPLVPGIPILLASLAINYIGDGLRDALDPRMKRS